jgi:hypothetical protein
MEYPRIIGITGRKQHGKDTIGNYLVEKYGYTRIAFADAIKDMLRPTFGFTEEQLHGHKKEEIDDFWQITPRQVLQFVGTELFRDQMATLIPHVGTDFWVCIVKKKILDLRKINPHAKFVITDVRFENEMECIREFNGTTIRIVRSTMAETAESHHSSENTVDSLNVDFQIANDSSLESLHQTVDSLIFSLFA